MRIRIVLVLVFVSVLVPVGHVRAAVCPAVLSGGGIYITGTSGNDVIDLRQDTVADPDMFECRLDGGSFIDVAPINTFTRIDINLGDGSDTINFGDAAFPTEDLSRPIFSSANEILNINAQTSGLFHSVSVGAQRVTFDNSAFRVDFSGVDAMAINLGTNNDDIFIDLPLTATPLQIVPGPGSNTIFLDGTNGGESIELTGSAIRINGNSLVSYSAISQITVSAGEGNDRVKGGPLADILVGDAGNDRVSGGGGPDQLEGGPGTDRCFGGPGKDTFKSCETKRQ